jgi:uncharacterized damage-inducible protein DinB
MSSNPVAENFLAFAAKRMQRSQFEIGVCVSKLTEEQMSRRGGPHENSVANLLLHLEGNIRQWILHGIADQPDVRRRDDEFALASSVTAAEAHARFNATVEEACRAITSLDQERLLTIIDPQPTGTSRHATILEAIAKVFAHLEYHTGQIVVLTKQMTGADLDLSIPRKR